MPKKEGVRTSSDSEIKSLVFDDVMDLFFNKEFEETQRGSLRLVFFEK